MKSVVVSKAWAQLLTVRELTFEARSCAPVHTGWNGSGKGVVQVDVVEAGVILFRERGAWTPEGGLPTKFSNVFRWTADPEGRFIRLEHLRLGPERPVYLFDLVPVNENFLASSTPHVCRKDLYVAQMEFDAHTVKLRWTVSGPQKDENISYVYQ